MDKLSNYSFQFSLKEKFHRLMVMEESCVGQIFPNSLLDEHRVADLWSSFADILDFKSITEMTLNQQKFQNILMNNVPVIYPQSRALSGHEQ
jgi:hypothetical protein